MPAWVNYYENEIYIISLFSTELDT